jgi:3-methylfumaryl-CoA hydratase
LTAAHGGQPLTVPNRFRQVFIVFGFKRGFVVKQIKLTWTAIHEEHDIVYRDLASPGEPAPAGVPAPQDALWTREIRPDDVLLFRYSALTFNGHRIHYDRSYVTHEEGYPGLIVHGPLIATLLVDLVRRQVPGARLASFQFRAVRPTFDLHPFRLNGRPSADGKTIDLWASDHEGWLTMQAQATLA